MNQQSNSLDIVCFDVYDNDADEQAPIQQSSPSQLQKQLSAEQKPPQKQPTFPKESQVPPLEAQLHKSSDSPKVQDLESLPINPMTARYQSDQTLVLYTLEEAKSRSQFLVQPVPKHRFVQLTITKNLDGLNYFYPRFDLYISDPKAFLCSAKKQAFNNHISYLFSWSQEIFNRKSDQCIGKLKADATTRIFQLFNPGENPETTSFLEEIRKEYLFLKFSNERNPSLKRMQVVIPALVNEKPIEFKPLSYVGGLMRAFASMEHKESTINFINKAPHYNEKKQAYQLNFTERVSKSSKKNFQLVPHNDQASGFVVQFGKCEKRVYNLDVSHPFSILQAFAVCISQFEVRFNK